MKSLFKTALILSLALTSLSIFADETDMVFAERLAQRYNETTQVETELITETSLDLEALKNESMNELLAFATKLDLHGTFKYKLNDSSYMILVDGSAKYFFYSIDIIKNGTPTTRRYYEASIRVDGVLFVSRIANYDY